MSLGPAAQAQQTPMGCSKFRQPERTCYFRRLIVSRGFTRCRDLGTQFGLLRPRRSQVAPLEHNNRKSRAMSTLSSPYSAGQERPVPPAVGGCPVSRSARFGRRHGRSGRGPGLRREPVRNRSAHCWPRCSSPPRPCLGPGRCRRCATASAALLARQPPAVAPVLGRCARAAARWRG